MAEKTLLKIRRIGELGQLGDWDGLTYSHKSAPPLSLCHEEQRFQLWSLHQQSWNNTVLAAYIMFINGVHGEVGHL